MARVAEPDASLVGLQIRVTTPATAQPVAVSLAGGETVLIGREPVPSSSTVNVRAVPVPGAMVSGNHVSVAQEADALVVRDLGSRNGTWLRLPPGAMVRVMGPSPGELSLELARTSRVAASLRPQDATWAGEGDFAAAVTREVERWLPLTGSPITASLARRTGRDDALIPLTVEWGLRLSEAAGGHTIAAGWDQVVEPLLQYVHDQQARLAAERSLVHDASFVMASPAFWEAHRKVCEASARALPLVLLGETGSGKGTLARCYHDHSDRRERPFEVVNCAEIDRHFAHTRLFGAKRGAYTGCVADVAGAVECAKGGTLFLDEVADLPLDVQGELLSFLDDGRYKRLGDDQWREVDVRVVCGTNADLRRAVGEKRFRGDLWYRVAGRVVVVPPLRERPEDVTRWLRSRTLGERPGAVTLYEALSAPARALVMAHPWRGNFRELESFAWRLPDASGAGGIDAATCREALREGILEDAAPPGADPWERLLGAATSAWRGQSQRLQPERSADFREYVEEVLKPFFFARTLGVDALDALPDRPTPSFEEMARRMGCDAATVKSQLARYFELRRATA